MKKAQGSTEYLVILAVVLVVALIVVSLLVHFLGLGRSASASQTKAFWKEQSPLQLLDWSMYNVPLTTTPVPQKSQMTLRNSATDTVTLKKIQVMVGSNKYDLFNKTTAAVDKTKNNLVLTPDKTGVLIQSGASINGLYLNQTAVTKYICPQANNPYSVHIDFVYEENGIAQVEGDANSPQIVGVCQQG